MHNTKCSWIIFSRAFIFSGSSWWMAICATSVRCTLFLVFLPVQYEYQFALLGSRSKDWNSLLIDSIHPSCSYDNQPTSLAPFIFINFFGPPRFPRYSDATSCSTQKGVNVSLFDVIISKGTRRWLSSRLWRFYKWMRPLWREMRNNLTCLMVSKRIFFFGAVPLSLSWYSRTLNRFPPSCSS